VARDRVVVGGAVQDFTILVCSLRRTASRSPDGEEEVSRRPGDGDAGRALHHDHPAAVLALMW